MMDIRKLGACWFALQTRCNQEQNVAIILRNKGYEEFLPLCKSSAASTRALVCRDHDNSMRALYPGYLFCRFNPNVQGPIVTTPGVIRIVRFGDAPAPIKESEIENIRSLVLSDLPLQACSYTNVGKTVRVISGPLKGVEGILTRVKNQWRVVVSIHILQKSAMVEVDTECIEMVGGLIPRFEAA